MTKITIETPDTFTAQDIEDLRYLFADTLGEFIARRSPAELYVLKRYTHDNVAAFGPKGMLDKIEQVKRRLALAEKLRAGAHSVTVEVES